MNGKYFIVGTFFGIQLRIHYSWLIIFALIAWTIITSYIPSFKHGLSPLVLTSAGLLVTFIFFASVIAHEYAHSIVANRRGMRIKRITLFVFGGASELQHEPDSAKTELLMTVAGPLTSFIISGVFAGLWLLAMHWHITAIEVICQPVAVLNFIVGLFNLLPAFPLDGGRILRSVVWLIRKDFASATRIATNAGVALSYLMIGVGVLSMFAGDLVGGLWFAIIGFFLLQSARISYSQTVAQSILTGVKVSDVYNDSFVTVPLGISINEFLSGYVLRYKHYDFLAADQSGKPIGIIEMSQVTSDPHRHYENSIDKYIQPLTKSLALKPSDPAIKAQQVMQSHNLDILPVMSGKELIGVVMRRYLEDYVAVHRLRR